MSLRRKLRPREADVRIPTGSLSLSLSGHSPLYASCNPPRCTDGQAKGQRGWVTSLRAPEWLRAEKGPGPSPSDFRGQDLTLWPHVLAGKARRLSAAACIAPAQGMAQPQRGVRWP